jgi:hypothetical protein
MRALAETTKQCSLASNVCRPSKVSENFSRYYHPTRAITRFLWNIMALESIIRAASLLRMVVFGTRFRNDVAIRWEGGGGWECCATLLPENLARLHKFSACASNPAHSMLCVGVAQLLLHERSRMIQRFDTGYF